MKLYRDVVSVLRAVFEMSRSRLMTFVETSRLGHGYKIKGLGPVSDLHVLFYSELYAKFLTT